MTTFYVGYYWFTGVIFFFIKNEFGAGSIPGVTFDQMKLQIKLGVPRPLQHSLDIERVKSVFP